MNNYLFAFALLIGLCACSESKHVVREQPKETVKYENSSTEDSATLANIVGNDLDMINAQLMQINYPSAALQNGIAGTVKLKFNIDAKGEVENIVVISKRLGFGLEEEAIRVLKMTSGKWTPTTEQTKVTYILPVNFTIH